MGKVLRAIDLPPVWMGLFILAAFVLDWLLPGLGFGWPWMQLLGQGLILLGIVAMALAVWEFLRARTTFIPRRVPTAFLQAGIYRFSRNPIYLGDALVLGGLIFYWDVLPGLLLVPLFCSLITRRYILGEEAGLEAKFGEEFTIWRSKVRRWL